MPETRRARHKANVARRRAAVPNPAMQQAYGQRADGSLIGQGMAVWVGYVALKRILQPFRWMFGRFGMVVFNWKDYRRYFRELTVFDVAASPTRVSMGVGITVLGLKALRRARRGTERIVLHESLLPGDQIIIRQVPKKAPRRR